MNKDKIRQAVNVLAFIVMLVVNSLANILPLNGQTTGEISDRFDVYFVPAGYVFSIWGLIYLALLAFVVYQALPAQRENPRLRAVGDLFALSCVANVVWLFLWHYEVFALTLVAMLALLVLLIVIYLRLGTGLTMVPVAERWLVRLPFSIYLGWITVATIANVTSLLDFLGWGGWGIGPDVWAAVMLIAATGIATAVSFTRRDAAYMLVIVWAFAGIGIKHGGAPEASLVAISAWAASQVVLLMWVVSVLARGERRNI